MSSHVEEVARPRLPDLAADAHKGDAGRCLCLCGSRTMPGAAILVARAAQRAGAGLVAVGCLDPELLAVLPTAAPEAVLLDLSPTFGQDGRVAADAEDRLQERAPHARVVGPGLGQGARTRSLVESVLTALARTPIVFDADALNVLAGEPERFATPKAPVVLTPHPTEAGRLLGRTVPREEAGRVASAKELAERSGSIVCLKGRRTVLASAEGVFVNPTGNAGMATAGSGDVLAGILGAYLALAQEEGPWTPWRAAQAAVYVHGLAGDLARDELGARGVIASDLVRYLPAAQKSLGDAV